MIRANSSTWELGISSAAVVAKRIKEDLAGPYADQASPEALSAEVIRVALWALCTGRQTSSFTEASVTTRRLLELARAIWRPIADSYGEEHAARYLEHDGEPERNGVLSRELLDSLAEQGDLFSLSGGRWLPAPLRFVQVTPAHYLLVGGMPTHLLPGVALSALRLHGSFRHVEGDAISSLQQNAGISVRQFQALESWLGLSQKPEELLCLFDEYELQTVFHQQVSDSTLEAYVARVNKPQLLRWQALNQVDDGRYLLRASTPWGMHQYSIGFINGRKLIQQSAGIWQTDIRRLCYALDYRAGKPTRVSWHEKKGELILRSELPGCERKFLASVGTLQENADGSYYPRRWFFKDAAPVFERLKNLGIQVEAI